MPFNPEPCTNTPSPHSQEGYGRFLLEEIELLQDQHEQILHDDASVVQILNQHELLNKNNQGRI